MNKQNRNKLIDAEYKLMVARWLPILRVITVMSEKDEGIKKYKLPVIKTVTWM